MATVYLARDLRHDRRVALKVLNPDLGAVLAVERFLSEIKVTAKLQHPHILSLLDSGEAAGLLFYVMPFVDGETLRARLERERQLPIGDALRIARDVASALDYAHRHGVIHRDIKPENILLHDDRALVADFGIALAVRGAGEQRLTQTGISLGTPQYMSPEQAVGERTIDARSDVYALGAVTYEMLTGEPPFTGATAQAIAVRAMSEAPRALRLVRRNVPEEIEAAVLTALEKVPADRWGSIREFAAALEQHVVRARRRAPGRGSWPRWVAIAVPVLGTAALVVAIAVAWRDRRSQTAALPSTPSSSAQPSIAVLPLANVGGDPGNEYFSDGITEELIGALSRTRKLRVSPRSSSFAFKGKALDSRRIGDTLAVDHILEGSVQRAGHQLHVTISLTNVRGGYSEWSESYNRSATDVIAVEEELARAIVAKLLPTLAPSEKTSLIGAETEDAVAYDLYLRGRHFFSLRSREGFERAAEFFTQAIRRDSRFASAWAGLADSYCIQANFGYRVAGEVCPKSIEAARRALAIDSTHAGAHAALGFVHLFYDWNLSAAERELRRALALDPTSATTHLWLMQLASAHGDTARALEEIRAALKLEPLSLILNTRLGTALMRANRLPEAVAQVRRTLELDSTFMEGWRTLALVETVARDTIAALRAIRGPTLGIFGYIYAMAGKEAEARRVMREIEADPARVRAEQIHFAWISLALSQPDSAVAHFAAAVRERNPDVVFAGKEPFLARLRHDPRFLKLLRQAGVPLP